MATKKTKTDGRAKNGAEDRGLTEDSQLVRGPAELIGAMRELATKNGQTVSHVWREAAQQYLERSWPERLDDTPNPALEQAAKRYRKH